MTNPLNLGRHELAEMLADADEVAQFLGGFDPAKEGEDRTAIHIVDAQGHIRTMDLEEFSRWEKSIRNLSRMVEIE